MVKYAKFTKHRIQYDLTLVKKRCDNGVKENGSEWICNGSCTKIYQHVSEN